MLHLNTDHESGYKQVTKDANMVLKVMEAMDSNPFTATMPALINIATGHLWVITFYNSPCLFSPKSGGLLPA